MTSVCVRRSGLIPRWRAGSTSCARPSPSSWSLRRIPSRSDSPPRATDAKIARRICAAGPGSLAAWTHVFSVITLRLLVCVLLCCDFALATQKAASAQSGVLQVRVVDRNGATLQAKVTVQRDNVAVASTVIGDAGEARFPLSPGAYKVLIRQEGFYPAIAETIVVSPGQTTPLEVHLQDIRTHSEEVEVAAQASPIDPQQTPVTQTLTGEDVTNIPYPSTRDYRNILRFIPGAMVDNNGGLHIAGGVGQQTEDYLDGFEISQPTGGLALRLNPDSLRKINV